MAKREIADKVLRLKHGGNVNIPGIKDTITFDNGEEFHIVGGVVYMKGFPLPAPMQAQFKKWLLDNPSLFVEDTRNF